jgi:hypothetical protein
MASPGSASHTPGLPGAAVAGELVSALCFGCLGLFEPIVRWVTWPDLLFSWHISVIFFGTLAVAVARRSPRVLKPAVVLAAYIGLPNLLMMWQAAVEVGRVPGAAFSFAFWGMGMLGQVIVLWSCLARLVPRPPEGHQEVADHHVTGEGV